MTRLATTPDVFRHTSRTETTFAELVAGWRIDLRDIGHPGAVYLDDRAVLEAMGARLDRATELGCSLGQHLATLKAERQAAIHAPACATCGAARPTFYPSQGWGIIADAAACPTCLARDGAERAAA